MFDFPEVVALIGQRLDLDLRRARPESRLREDLSFDSLAMAELLVLFDHNGMVLSDDRIAEIRTLGDVHHCFATMAQPAGARVPAEATQGLRP